MLEIALIRHGKTAGNLEGRYVGRLDEPLCPEGEEQLAARRYPTADLLFCSPMRRCLRTAQLLYPDLSPTVLQELRETDFGAFEGKNYPELADCPAYRAFLDSGGATGFPGGEDPLEFRRRCRRGFSRLVRQAAALGSERAAVICHGGTIMAVMEAFCSPKQGFYSYQAVNGGGYLLRFAGRGKFEIVKEVG